jgi:hypothetical protein
MLPANHFHNLFQLKLTIRTGLMIRVNGMSTGGALVRDILPSPVLSPASHFGKGATCLIE